jgi:hypothetical protein
MHTIGLFIENKVEANSECARSLSKGIYMDELEGLDDVVHLYLHVIGCQRRVSRPLPILRHLKR